MSQTPSTLYQTRLNAGELVTDSGQQAVVTALEDFFSHLPHLLRGPPLFFAPKEDKRGLYLYGPVGRGKTMLMDMLYGSMEGIKKRRVHFHEFMSETHAAIHRLREGGRGNALDLVAKDIVKDAALLCFDEFQVYNIADAMILGRLFRSLFKLGAVVVVTSNTAPADLYKDGLQRALFLPFISMLEKRLQVVRIGDGVDHRISRLKGMPLYMSPHDARAHEALTAIFLKLTDTAQPHAQEITVDGRRLQVPREAKQVAWFTFDELCRTALGPSDYMALCERYHTIIIENVPEFVESEKDAALRFIHLIDVMYEKHANAIISAAKPLEALMAPNVTNYARFERARSRIYEMQTEGYIGAHHFAKNG